MREMSSGRLSGLVLAAAVLLSLLLSGAEAQTPSPSPSPQPPPDLPEEDEELAAPGKRIVTQDILNLDGMLYAWNSSVPGYTFYVVELRQNSRRQTMTILETPDDLIVFDSLKTVETTEIALTRVIAFTEKEISRAYLTGADLEGERYGGFSYFIQETDAPIFTLPSILRDLNSLGDNIGFNKGLLQTVESGSSVNLNEQVSLRFDAVLEEDPLFLTMQVTFGGLSTLLAGDSILNGYHYPVTTSFPELIGSVQAMVDEDLQFYIAGRGAPGTLTVARNALEYLEFADETSRSVPLAANYINAMTNEFPGRLGIAVMEDSARRLADDFPLGEDSAAETPTDQSSSTIVPASPAPEEDDGVCFPASSSVKTEDGRLVAMEQLQVGQRILIAPGQYATVCFFSHRSRLTWSEFVEIKAGNATVLLSPSHFIVSGRNLVSAASMRPADLIETGDGEKVAVDSVQRVSARGLYAPHTTSDAASLVVDGIVVSEFTQSVHPRLAAILLKPIRTLGRLTGFLHLGTMPNQSRKIARALRLGTTSQIVPRDWTSADAVV